MLIDALSSSTLLLIFTTLALFAIGRVRIESRIWRVALIAAAGAAAAWLTGQTQPTAPAVLATIAAIVIALVSPRSWWAAGAAAFATLVVGTVVYMAYLVGVTVTLTDSPVGLLLGLVLLAIEFAALVLMVAAVFEVVDSLCRPLVVQRLPDAPDAWPTVCLQVPAHEEPPDLVIETLRSLVAIDYPRDRLMLQVIDNNTTDPSLWQPLERECRRLAAEGHRIQFVHLEDWPGFKSGALNWGRRQLPDEVEVVGVVDADYVVDPRYLKATVPYFRDPSVAFVQTPQEYRGWRDSAFYRACHTGFEYFFRVGMVSRSYRNSIIFAGTMGLIRRLDLDAIGGWDEEVITEDAEASLRMLAGGGRGIFVPQAYGRGIMPLTYEALRKQRFRWAFGGVQILRKHWHSLMPWSRSRLTWRQRRDYLLGGLWWFNDGLTLLFTVFVLATALGVATGHPFVIQRLWGLGIVLPLVYIALGLTRYVWGIRVATGVSASEAFDAMRVNLSLSWVVTLACVRALVQRHGVFLRTPKFRGSQLARELRVVAGETILAGTAVVVGVWAMAVAGPSALTLTVLSLLAWSVLIYGSATSFAVGDPTRPPAAMAAKARLELGGGISRSLQRPQLQVSAVLAVVGTVLLVAAAVAVDAGRPPVGGQLPIAGNLLPAPRERPSASPSSPSATPGASATPGDTAAPGSTATPAPSGTPRPAPSGTAAPSPSPTPAASPTAPQPTSSPAAATSPTPARTPTPTPPPPTPTATPAPGGSATPVASAGP